MGTTALFIDGENFRKLVEKTCTLNGIEFKRNTILNMSVNNLFKTTLQGLILDKKVYYASKLILIPETKAVSQELIKVQRSLKSKLEKEGFIFNICGRVRPMLNTKGALGIKPKYVFKEKGVDVKIGIDVVIAAVDKEITHVVLCSSDSDLQPAIKEARKRGLKITYLGFQSFQNKGLSYTTDNTILFRDSEILDSMKNISNR